MHKNANAPKNAIVGQLRSEACVKQHGDLSKWESCTQELDQGAKYWAELCMKTLPTLSQKKPLVKMEEAVDFLPAVEVITAVGQARLRLRHPLCMLMKLVQNVVVKQSSCFV